MPTDWTLGVPRHMQVGSMRIPIPSRLVETPEARAAAYDALRRKRLETDAEVGRIYEGDRQAQATFDARFNPPATVRPGTTTDAYPWLSADERSMADRGVPLEAISPTGSEATLGVGPNRFAIPSGSMNRPEVPTTASGRPLRSPEEEARIAEEGKWRPEAMMGIVAESLRRKKLAQIASDARAEFENQPPRYLGEGTGVGDGAAAAGPAKPGSTAPVQDMVLPKHAAGIIMPDGHYIGPGAANPTYARTDTRTDLIVENARRAKIGLPPMGSVGEWKRSQAETAAGTAEADLLRSQAEAGTARAGRMAEAGTAGAEAAVVGMGIQNRTGAAQAGVVESQARLQQIIAERTGHEIGNMTSQEFTQFLTGSDPNTQVETLRAMADAMRESQPEVAKQIDQMVLARMGITTAEEAVDWNRGLAWVGSLFGYLMRGQPKETRLVPMAPSAVPPASPASTVPSPTPTAPATPAMGPTMHPITLPPEATMTAPSVHERMNQVVAGRPMATPAQMVAAANVLKIQLQRPPSEEELAQYLTQELGLDLPAGS